MTKIKVVHLDEFYNFDVYKNFKFKKWGNLKQHIERAYDFKTPNDFN
jgi:hypothetical protein